MPRNKTVIILFFLFVLSILPLRQICLAQDLSWLEEADWRVFSSKYCNILIHPDVNLERLNKRVKIRFYSLDKKASSSKGQSTEKQLAEKVDQIFKKVQRVLDMYPREVQLNLKIFRTQAQLDEEYSKIFGHNDGMLRISFYVHKYTTIFTTEQAIREGVLAHEMGHAIADHYFLVNPSEKIKELLAQYAEMHLED